VPVRPPVEPELPAPLPEPVPPLEPGLFPAAPYPLPLDPEPDDPELPELPELPEPLKPDCEPPVCELPEPDWEPPCEPDDPLRDELRLSDDEPLIPPLCLSWRSVIVLLLTS
jgi:hypothetical protein